MRVKLRGERDLEKILAKRFGKSQMQHVVDQALIKGAEKVADIIRQNMQSFADTGKSARATNVSKPVTVNGLREVKIHWQDSTERWRIIHLNEYGHFDKAGKWVNTAGKGVIENAMRQGRNVYFATVKDELRKL
ncbi:hypothetical protein [Loigolactobacillus rennini]|uniref:Phage protein n=1 Tax=Loigolactobacillus rennini DSM 20253 TaxID=1423796 RepID=A0A0R2CMC9_9LACO|nr:hypothetical protein [Loigolactobacillus rennini]KRM92797.1 hypothetical protein FC24_GL000967 [Loigolactobacillus rennini DSM 20253]